MNVDTTEAGPASPRDSMVAGKEPANGDVVVRPHRTNPGSFTICQIPGPPSMLADSQHKALDMARGFATVHRVDVWFGDGPAVGLVYAHRTSPAITPAGATRRRDTSAPML